MPMHALHIIQYLLGSQMALLGPCDASVISLVSLSHQNKPWDAEGYGSDGRPLGQGVV